MCMCIVCVCVYYVCVCVYALLLYFTCYVYKNFAVLGPTLIRSFCLSSGATVAVAVTLPVIFLVLIIVLVLTGIIIFLIWRQQKLHVSFQKMSQDRPLIETFHKTSEEAENIDDAAD